MYNKKQAFVCASIIIWSAMFTIKNMKENKRDQTKLNATIKRYEEARRKANERLRELNCKPL